MNEEEQRRKLWADIACVVAAQELNKEFRTIGRGSNYDYDPIDTVCGVADAVLAEYDKRFVSDRPTTGA